MASDFVEGWFSAIFDSGPLNLGLMANYGKHCEFCLAGF